MTIRWASTILFLLLSCLSTSIALNDQGNGIGDWTGYLVIGCTALFGLFSMLAWGRQYVKYNSKPAMALGILPFFIAGMIFLLFKLTDDKINKPYFLLATNPDDNSHQFLYYFRVDSTLKTHGIFFWNEANDFQRFSMRGDTIFLDRIIDHTGIHANIYVKMNGMDMRGDTIRQLVPLNEQRQVIDSLTKFDILEEKPTLTSQ
jgi:hypothetical protein